jgi:hypothetical protein
MTVETTDADWSDVEDANAYKGSVDTAPTAYEDGRNSVDSFGGDEVHDIAPAERSQPFGGEATGNPVPADVATGRSHVTSTDAVDEYGGKYFDGDELTEEEVEEVAELSSQEVHDRAIDAAQTDNTTRSTAVWPDGVRRQV